MKKIIILWILTCFALSVQSQTITIKDKDTGEPLEMVSIFSISPNIQETTNALGQADFSGFKGSEKIGFRIFGHKTVTKSYAEIAALKFEIKMISTTSEFDDVIISATRWKQSSNDVPSKISVISSQELELLNPQTAADLLGTSGEVYIQKSQQGGGSPMIRGFSANRLLYSVDGVRMNSAIFRAGNLQNVISIDPLSIERTEVYFGPGSVIYGSDALGGVMSFKTLTPQLSQSDTILITGSAMSRLSSANNELTNHFDITLGSKKWSSVTSFTHSKFGDLRMGTNGRDEYLKNFTVQRIDGVDKVIQNADPLTQAPSGYTQTNLMQKIRFKPNEKWDIEYGFHYSETSEYGRYDRSIETQGNGLPSYALWNYGPQIWMMNNLSFSNNQSNKVYDHVTLRLAQQTFEESRIDRKFNHYRLRTQEEQVQAYSANLDFEKIVKKHNLFYGLEYVRNDVKSTGSAINITDNTPISVPDRYPGSNWSSYAAYLNYQYHVSKKFLIQTGIRYSYFDMQSDFSRHLEFYPFDFTDASLKNSATTGSLGFVYNPANTWKISANASTAFRAPNVDDIGKIFDFNSGEIVVPNTSLEAEYVYNADVNISKIFGGIVKIDLTGFYTYLDQAMVRREFQVNGQDSINYDGQMSKVYAIQNAASGKIYGFNAGIEVKLPSGFGLESRYNYQIGEEEMEDGTISRSRHAAPAFGVTRLTFSKKKLNAQVYFNYNAEVTHENLSEEEKGKDFIYAKDENGENFSPSWCTLNLKAMYQFHQNFSVSAGVENITDQRYRPYSSGLVAPGRNVIISLKANF